MIVPEWYQDKPLTDGAEFRSEPLFWLVHQGQGIPEDALELAFGADYDDAQALSDRLWSAEAWPTFTVALRHDCAIEVVYRNFPDDQGIDYLFAAPSWTAVLANTDVHPGPALAWHEFEPLAPEDQLLLLPLLGDDETPPHAVDVLAVAFADLTATESPAALAEEVLANQQRATWRDRDGVWICDGGYSLRCPHNTRSLTPPELSAVSAALNQRGGRA